MNAANKITQENISGLDIEYLHIPENLLKAIRLHCRLMTRGTCDQVTPVGIQVSRPRKVMNFLAVRRPML